MNNVIMASKQPSTPLLDVALGEVQKIPLDKIKLDLELYPRFEANPETVNQYSLSLDQLPPIIVAKVSDPNYDYILVEGNHRLIAHTVSGREEIDAIVKEGMNRKEILIEAIRINSTRGLRLTIAEKRMNAKRLKELGLDVPEISRLLSVGTSTVYPWVSDLIREEKFRRDDEILELFLQCHTQTQISEDLGIDQKTVSNSLRKNSRFGIIPKPENLFRYNVWRVGGLSPTQLKYPGQTPLDIVENIIYYYTAPPQLEPRLELTKVVDPMAGSGIVRDACQQLLRRYMLYDLRPLRQDIPIEKNDILEGLPEKAKGSDLVYLDPPYYKLMGEYPDNMFNESYPSFLEAMNISFKNIRETLRADGNVALVLKPMNEEMLGGDWLDMTHDCINIAEGLGYTLIKRICAPLSTQQFSRTDVPRAEERRVLLNTLRDIVILQKKKT